MLNSDIRSRLHEENLSREIDRAGPSVQGGIVGRNVCSRKIEKIG